MLHDVDIYREDVWSRARPLELTFLRLSTRCCALQTVQLMHRVWVFLMFMVPTATLRKGTLGRICWNVFQTPQNAVFEFVFSRFIWKIVHHWVWVTTCSGTFWFFKKSRWCKNGSILPPSWSPTKICWPSRLQPCSYTKHPAHAGTKQEMQLNSHEQHIYKWKNTAVAVAATIRGLLILLGKTRAFDCENWWVAFISPFSHYRFHVESPQIKVDTCMFKTDQYLSPCLAQYSIWSTVVRYPSKVDRMISTCWTQLTW